MYSYPPLVTFRLSRTPRAEKKMLKPGNMVNVYLIFVKHAIWEFWMEEQKMTPLEK